MRWSIGMANGEPLAVAGLYREWGGRGWGEVVFFHPVDHQRRRPSVHQTIPPAGRGKALVGHCPERRLRRMAWMQRPRAREDVPTALPRQTDGRRAGAEGGRGQTTRTILAGGGMPGLRSPASKRFQRRDKISDHYTRCMNRTFPMSSTS